MKKFRIICKHHVTLEEKVFTLKARSFNMIDGKLLEIQWMGYSIVRIEEVEI